ncbi:MAG TPA: GDCCVxC domain-containing (seleno)protein [Gemmatimonadaceae bacterium]
MIRLESVLTCPSCGHAAMLTMPTDACVFFHACTGCGTLLRPKAGDCCVFCSYGTVPCPPVQIDPRASDCCQPAPLARHR